MAKFRDVNVDIPGVRVIADWYDVGTFDATGHHNGGTTFMDRVWPGALSPRLSWSVESRRLTGNAQINRSTCPDRDVGEDEFRGVKN